MEAKNSWHSKKSNYDMQRGGKVDALAFTVSRPCFIRKHGVVAHASLGSMGSILHMKMGQKRTHSADGSGD